MLRSNLVFLHIISAMLVFTAFGMEALALAQLRKAPDSARAGAALVVFGSSRRVGGPSMLLLLLTGLYLANAYWQWQGAWMGASLAGLVAVAAIGGLMSE